VDVRACLDELQKLGAVSHEEARSSLDRLESLEKSKPTLGQLGRYAAIGAVASPIIGGVADLVEGGPSRVLGGPGRRLRTIAASATKGALGASVIPIARTALDRHVEMNNLRDYMRQHPQE